MERSGSSAVWNIAARASRWVGLLKVILSQNSLRILCKFVSQQLVLLFSEVGSHVLSSRSVGRLVCSFEESIIGFVEASFTASFRSVDSMEVCVVGLEAGIFSQSIGEFSRRSGV